MNDGLRMASTGQAEDNLCVFTGAKGLLGNVQNRVRKKPKNGVRRARDVIQSAEGLLSMREALDLILSTTHT